MNERGAVAIELCGERLQLLPERALYWERTATLLVADAHFGKAASFRALGVAVPGGTTGGTLARLDAALDRTSARRLVFLGDLLHAREGRTDATFRALAGWKSARSGLEWTLVRGNHDRRAGDPPAELGIGCRDEPVLERPFVLAHAPKPSREGYVLGGHLHPAAELSGEGRARERLPCFWVRPDVTVLPALGEFTGVASIAAAAGDSVYAVAEGEVVRILRA
ncbi:MAG TPA: ligase-associated DNA damage response endonuclease PdeM [Gemmatimonadaceae bacterium]|nr:ligase-associated DNA damage response endonuclease PdeM [Gemmatimonadaceae bacterium]